LPKEKVQKDKKRSTKHTHIYVGYIVSTCSLYYTTINIFLYDFPNYCLNLANVVTVGGHSLVSLA